MAESSAAVEKQKKTLATLLELPCIRLRYSESPAIIAGKLRDLMLNRLDENPFERIDQGRAS